MSIAKFHSQIPLIDSKISKKRLNGNDSKSVQILMKNIKQKIKWLDCLSIAMVHDQKRFFLCVVALNYSLKYVWGDY